MGNKKLLAFLSEQKILIAIFLIGLFLTFQSSHFLTYYNIVNIVSSISIEGVIVIGMTFLVIVGDIDLSVGSVMALSTVLAIQAQKYGVAAGIITGIAGAMVVGLTNGLLVTKLKLSSIPVTLGMMIFVSGIVFALTKGLSVKGENPAFMKIAEPQFFYITGPIIIFIVLVILSQIILKRSIFGRNVYAVGSNSTASAFFGIKIDRVKIACFLITGLCAGIAGVLLAAKINVASGRLGAQTAILVITAVLLGGVSLSGGEGSVAKAFQGILFIGILNNAMVLLHLSVFIQEMIRGLVLILILVLDAINTRRAQYE